MSDKELSAEELDALEPKELSPQELDAYEKTLSQKGPMWSHNGRQIPIMAGVPIAAGLVGQAASGLLPSGLGNPSTVLESPGSNATMDSLSNLPDTSPNYYSANPARDNAIRGEMIRRQIPPPPEAPVETGKSDSFSSSTAKKLLKRAAIGAAGYLGYHEAKGLLTGR